MGSKHTKPTIGTASSGKKKKVKEATHGKHPLGVRHLVLKDGRRKVLEWRQA